jgi:acetolactate synthase-1/3 small subunit
VPYELDEMHSESELQPGASPLVAYSAQRQSIVELARLFSAKVVDVGIDSMVLELCAKSSRVDAFVELLRPFGILEAARSGTMAMPRGQISGLEIDEVEDKEDSGVDATMLPPG